MFKNFHHKHHLIQYSRFKIQITMWVYNIKILNKRKTVINYWLYEDYFGGSYNHIWVC